MFGGFAPAWPMAAPAGPGAPSSVVHTQQQERGAGDPNAWYETYRRIKTLKSKRSLWRLRQEKPELFKQRAKLEAHLSEHKDAAPHGFKPCNRRGWLYSAEKRVYLEEKTGRRCWLDEATNTYKDLYEGDLLPLAFSSAATTRPAMQPPGAGGSAAAGAGAAASSRARASATPAASSTSQPAGLRHVAIPDLHRAAEALKVDIDHLDRPAAMLAIFSGAGPDAVPAEASVCALHTKLLRRLGAFRGEWVDSTLQEAVIGALDDLAADHGGARPCGAVALAMGDRVVAAATPGAHFSLAACPGSPSPGGSASISEPPAAPTGAPPLMAAAPLPAAPTAVACCGLAETDDCKEIHVALVVGELGTDGGSGTRGSVLPSATPQLLFSRPRAASIALLGALRERGAQGPLAAGCARLGPALGGLDAASAKLPGGPAAKRQRTGEACKKVRVRQVLLRYAGSARPMDPVRKKPAKRSLEEAELEMVGVLARLDADGVDGFPAVCRAVSECQSALRGGELAGDLGWLDSSAAQQEKGKEAVRPQVPASVLRMASALRVGEIGDVVSSEIGVHLLQRTA